jgi:tRNA A37 methylthiotransferase MiaB
MHTATRLAGPLIERARRANPGATLAAYGLYAPLNAAWLAERGIDEVLGPEAEQDLVALATGAPRGQHANLGGQRLPVPVPDRTGLPPLARYASLAMPDGSRRVTGSTDATRGCKHLCRHCPIVPVYGGRFRAVPLEAVLADVAAQVTAGAEHITFGDPDFFNGPTHARRLVERLARAHPGLTYDVTVKIEHLLAHADLLPMLRDTGCLFVTSAVESIDDAVLARLRKGHTRDDFVRAVSLCRRHDLVLSPTFIPFTPWTSSDGYAALLALLDELDLVEQVAPIQLAIRLLVTDRSPLLELDDVRAVCDAFDAASLTWPWSHPDRRVDALQGEAMRLVATRAQAPRGDVFDALMALAHDHAGLPPTPGRSRRPGRAVPQVSEPWYCCAEPDPRQFDLV